MKTKAVLVVMLVPALVLYILTFAAPMVIAGRLSLFETGFGREAFVGLANYTKALNDRFFVKSFVNSFVLLLLIVPASIVAAYKISAFLSTFDKKTQGVMRFILYVPGLAAGLVMALLWRWFLHGDGLVNSLLATIHLPGVPWLTDAWPARISVALIIISGGLGATVLILSATICGIPKELREAAFLDGAREREYRRYVMRPIVMPTILLVLLLNIVGILQIWEISYMLFYLGGPEGATASPVYEIFMTAFLFGKRGLASAKGVMLMVVIAAVIAVKQRLEKWVSS